MKKIFSMILAVTMVLNLFIAPVTAEASEVTVTSIEFEPYYSYEKCDCFVMDETGEVIEEKTGNYFYYYYFSPAEGKANLSDGSSIDIEYGRFEFDGDTYYVNGTSDQSYTNQWTAGNTYEFDVVLLKNIGGGNFEPTGIFTTCQVEIKECPVANITADPIILYQGIDGYSTSDWDKIAGVWTDSYTKYNTYDIPVTVNFKDGSSQDTYTGSYIEYDGEEYGVLSHDKQSFKNQLKLGDNSFTVSVMGYEETLTFTIKENPVKDITIEQLSFYEGTHGSYSRTYDFALGGYTDWYFRYDLYEIPVTINFKDPEIESIETFIGAANVMFGDKDTCVEIIDNQDIDNQYEVGTNKFTVSAFGFEQELEFEILPTPVDSIEIAPISVIEGTSGYSYDGIWYYDFSEAKKTIHFKDGTTVETNGYCCEYNDELYEFSSWSDQKNDTDWDPLVNKYTFAFMGAMAEAGATILESPVENIEILKAGCFEKTHCEYDDWYEHDIYSLDNVSARIYFKDGTYTDTSKDGSFLYEGKKYYAEINGNQNWDNFYEVGNNSATITAMNRSYGFDYVIAKYDDALLNDIELTEISVCQLPEKTIYKQNEEDLDLTGAKLELKYNCGTSRVITLSSDMVFGFDNTKLGTQTLSAVFGGKTATFEVEVEEVKPAERIFETDNVLRSCGETRYETALATANNLKKALNVEKFDAIIIANGTNYPDALAGSYLSTVKKAPVLLIGTGKNAPGLKQAIEYIENNLDSNGVVYILGGTSTVSARAEARIRKAASKVVRISGADRYETNLNILKKANADESEVLLIAGAQGFADALSASATGYPVMLANGNTGKLTEDQIAFIKNSSFKKVYILGGTVAVPEAIESEIKSLVPETTDIKRLAGENRYETSLKIAKEFFSEAKNISIANGDNFPDGLTGGPLAYFLGGPLILVNETDTACANLFAEEKEVEALMVFGGTNAVSENTEKSILLQPGEEKGVYGGRERV